MIRPLAVSMAAGVALMAAAASGAGESFPVVHNEPITIRVLGGKDGRPLGRLHLTLIAGYDRRDMGEQLFREEMLTDAHGQVRLSKKLANLPWLQVWVGKKSLCQRNPRKDSFSVELMRRDGLSAPNLCGRVTVEDKPGVFTVFVKGKGVAPDAPSKAVAAAVAALPAKASLVATAQAAVETGIASCCSACSKKARQGRSSCGRLVILLPGLAVALR